MYVCVGVLAVAVARVSSVARVLCLVIVVVMYPQFISTLVFFQAKNTIVNVGILQVMPPIAHFAIYWGKDVNRYVNPLYFCAERLSEQTRPLLSLALHT